jgi:hypothetical protein
MKTGACGRQHLDSHGEVGGVDLHKVTVECAGTPGLSGPGARGGDAADRVPPGN